MLNTLFSGSTIPILEQVANFTSARHEVLAGNIANMDTPGYRVRDLSPEVFQQRLKEAIETRHNDPASAAEYASPSGSSPATKDDALSHVSDSVRAILYHDETDVGLEQQVSEMSKNQTQYNMAIALMRSQFSLLQAAISERA
jgi:flagellar basal-body rod protein FlgB